MHRALLYTRRILTKTTQTSQLRLSVPQHRTRQVTYKLPSTRPYTSRSPWPAPAKRQSPNTNGPYISRDGYKHFGDGNGGRKRMPNPYGRYILAASAAGVTYYVYANLDYAPFTGRPRILGISRSAELAIGKEAFHQVVRSFDGQILPPNHATTLRVRRVVARIAGTVRQLCPELAEGFEWTVVVAENEHEPNALCVPGGRILITTGLLRILPTDDELAIVLGHEIAHALNRHGVESMHLQRMILPIMLILDNIFEMRWLSSMLVSLLLSLPNSRKLEFEADEVGLILCAEACFDPRQAPIVFSNLAKVLEEPSGTFVSDKLTPFLSTHPQNAERSAKLEASVPEKMRRYHDKCGFSSTFPRVF